MFSTDFFLDKAAKIRINSEYQGERQRILHFPEKGEVRIIVSHQSPNETSLNIRNR